MPGTLTGPGWDALLAAATGGDRAACGALARLLRRRGHLRPGAELPPVLAEQLWLVVLGSPAPDPALWDLLRGRVTGSPRARALAWLTGPSEAGASEAGASEAGASEAGASEAGASEAGASEAGASEAGASEAGASEAGASEAGASEAGASEAGASEAGASEAGASEAGASEAGASEAGASEAGASEAGASEAGASEAGASEAGASEAGASEAGASEAGASEAGASEAGASEAGASEAGASEAGASEAGASEAGASEAGASEAGASEAGASEAGASEAGASEAGASEAGASEAGPSEAGTGGAGTGQGGAGQGGAGQDGMSFDDPVVRRAAVDTAGRDDGHPAAALARERVRAAGAAAVLDELSRLALDRPGLAAWCAAHSLLPADPPDAAALLLLTGQTDRHRALDPDGALLAAAFAVAGPVRRERLLEAVAGAGVDLVALAAGRVGRDPRQRAFVVEHLTDRRDWPAAWRMIWDLPVAEAVAAAHRLGPWRPERDGGLFAVLAAADPDRLRAAAARLPRPVRVAVGGDLNDLALSPDASRLALRYRAYPGQREFLDDVDLGSGRVVHRYVSRGIGGDPGRRRGIVHFGASIVDAGSADLRRPAGLRRCAGGRQAILHGPAGFSCVRPLGAGFVALRTDGTLLFGGPDGVRRTAGPVRPTMHHHDNGQWLAVAPHGAYLAVAVEEALVLLDGHGAPVVTRPGAGYRGVAFAAADQVVALEHGAGLPRLTRWRIAGAALVQEATAEVPAADDLDGLDGTGLLVLADGTHLARCRDALTLEPRDLGDPGDLGDPVDPVDPDDLGALRRRPYPRAAAGRVAVVHARDVEVRPHPAYRLAARPLGELVPADLGTVEEELARGAHEVLTVLRDCLRARFGTEIALGCPGARAAGPTDIALGAPGTLGNEAA
ncbi:hypothetical protein KZZ52_32635 [Dactylosporangium sp. AC04546]|uniref:hypothetical protein n=1 Tax=Dactylosporangium sp. AC04546 TaxID=2862460 RepID=UPI002E7B98A2|nr:hypothetical protein [Dactylosporangium sp. AC04546]WVK78740.1 hypothetical protein KZZ52_32635 [Dactylosporangium sp. AC04546]